MAIARVTEVIAASPESWQDAVEKGLERANRTLRNITGIEVTGLKAKVDDGRISEYRVQMNIIFILE
ncbi:MAG: dodecin domain-containing protein [Candidatus Hydrogenedentota bacterium]|nr:MAG: dodecin domain-containing protein [Candidatus Hydrogenedentota bacterium]